ncbi:hypothetical protein [Streptosporangium sp. NPDC020145]|uniref:hypothetical protein n=1 Tax=Streptosporangium sp. NPDC020145 TaxID=3154694 RepID=UPI003420FA9D
MPKLLFARAPKDAVEERKIRRLAGARHASADWIRRAQIIALARTQPAGRPVRDPATDELSVNDETGPGAWTLDTLTAAAHELGIVVARSQVRRILLAEGVRRRRTRSWATSHDPHFAPKEPASLPFMPARRE